MIFITVKFKVRPEHSDGWLNIVDDFTRNTRQEPGNLWFEWSRSVDDPNEFVLVEAFKDDAAEAHVKSDHFIKGLDAMRPALVETPRIINFVIPGEDWSRMGELEIKAV
jgi:quinol monooxygenase YgiN